MNLRHKVVNRLIRLIFLIAPAILLFGRGWGAVQVNRAFVTLNHQPSVFTADQDPLILATAEA